MVTTAQAKRTAADKVIVFLKSRRFYLIVLGIFLFESAWIAFSALYPQAFDENFHFGLIKVYSHYWLPIFAHQPPDANAYGAVARDPSYLYHYLMSFPYRLLALFIHSQTAMVIILRLMDTGLFAVGLVLFRRVLLRAGVSRALANVCLLLFILMPIVPQLAAQVSYDDLLFPLVAWVCLLAFGVIDQLKQGRLSFQTVTILLTMSILSCLVTYAALPLLLAVIVFLLWAPYSLHKNSYKGLWKSIVSDIKAQSLWLKVSLLCLLAVAVGLFLQRDGVNLVKYHSIVPNCSVVLSVKQCSAYSAWYVDYTRHQQVIAGGGRASNDVVVYTVKWLYWMWYRLFFAVNGPASNFASNPPLAPPSVAAILIAALGVLAIIRWRKLFYKNYYIILLFVMSAIYIIALFVKGYSTYHYTNVLENMNGRYLIPVLLPIAALAGLAFSRALRSLQFQKVLITVVVLVLFLQGGGFLTFVLSSDQSWYWPNNAVVKVNNAAKKIVIHVVVRHTVVKENQ
jgi:hypothetical protein